jgi:glycosyltransferase involved in cell wall biosynthesis
VSRPIRVLELRSADRSGGGPDKTILLGARLADRSRVAVTVCYLRDLRDTQYDIGERAARLGLDYVEVHERHSLDARIWTALRRLIRERDIDIVHAHEYKTDLLALLLSRVEPIAPLSTVHGWSGHSRRETYVYYPVDRRLLRHFPRLIAVSDEIRDMLVEAGTDPQRISTVLNAIDASAFVRDRRLERGHRRSYAAGEDTITIGAIGRLAPEKRFDLLIDALARLRARGRAVHLFFAGDGPLRPALEAQAASLGVSGNCTFLGHTRDVIGVHHALDVFVQTSDHEGTPNCVLEAMALETPIVATAVGGTRQLIVDGVHGLLIPRRDPDALVHAIESIVEQPDAARVRARAARHRVETDLSFERRTRIVEGVYEELMDTYHPKRGVREGSRPWAFERSRNR